MPNFIDQLKEELGRIIPVVCDDMFEYVKSENSIPIPLKEYICMRLEPSGDAELFDTINNNFYYGISQYESKNRKSFSSFIYDSIQSAKEQGRIRLKECVRDFLVKGDFPLIITTFPFELIEDIIHKGEGENVDTCSIYYDIDSRNDMPIILRKNRHIVYHLFGGKSKNRWVYNEQSLLRYMYALQNTDIGAKNLVSYINNGNKDMYQLLVMGSVLPDWLFRFLVYPIYKDNLKDTGGFWIPAKNTEQELRAFLERNNYIFPKDTDNVSDILHKAIDVNGLNSGSKSPKTIFVSYKRDSSDERLNRLIDLLKMYGIVWIDKEKVADGGNRYWRNIKKAINLTDLFIPLVTEEYQDVFIKEKCDFENLLQFNPYANEDEENANDSVQIQNLPPILRESYYAIALKKKVCPIVLSSNSGDLGRIEKLARDGILPTYLFSEINMLLYDDENPIELNIKFED